MSIYNGKLVELLGIERNSDKYHLHIKLLFNEDFEMYWKVDDITANSLISLTEFNDKDKYRLSFQSSWDYSENQYKSMVSKTYREHSDRIYFSCSKDYLRNLAEIKEMNNIEDLNDEAFTLVDPIAQKEELIKQEIETVKQEIDIEVPQEKYTYKFSWSSVAVMSLIFVLLFSYSMDIYENRSIFSERVLAQSKPIEEIIVPASVDETYTEENTISDITENITEDISSEPVIPFLELDYNAIYNIPKGKVALTFDDGPSVYSSQIVDVLEEYGVGGTFFLTGLNVKKYPEQVEYVYSHGYSIGTHSMNHLDFSKLSFQRQERELLESSCLIEDIIQEKINLFRPPYGATNKQTKELMHDYEYKMVFWNNDPEDWRTRDAKKILNHIKNTKVSGAVILLHETKPVLDALPGIIEYLLEMDLEIVSLK